MDNELVRRGLASTLQRDGVADSLADGFKLIELSSADVGWAGVIIDEKEYWACDENGETEYGDSVQNTVLITWIEIQFFSCLVHYFYNNLVTQLCVETYD